MGKQYLHYIPEFDELVVFASKRKRFQRDAFCNDAKGWVVAIFICTGDFNFYVP